MNLTRRHFLRWSTFVAAGAATGFANLTARRAQAATFGPLVEDPMGLLDLPQGFSYQVLMQNGDMMSDGHVRRDLPDGMACFAGDDGEIILMCNHEISGTGGVSRIVMDNATLAIKSSNDVLGGTNRNCSGGPSPWGWLTCEEEAGGGVWLCPTATASELTGMNRVRIDDYGSFKHEAVCIDPDTLIAYLTEDDGASHFYRMVPTDNVADPFSGQLQALKAVGVDDYDTAGLDVGDTFSVEWVNVDPATARDSAKAAHAAIFDRGEGIWFFDGEVYFTATTHNQLFKFMPTGDGGTVELIANDLVSPDNVTVAPWGDVFVCEDQGGASRLRIVEPSGAVSDFARNAFSDGQELTGVCFSPDGKTLFVNLQKSGHTVAVRGPFPEVMVPGAGGTGGTSGTGGADATGGTPSTTGGSTATGGTTFETGGTGATGTGAMAPGTGASTADMSTAGSSDDAGCSCSQAGLSVNGIAAGMMSAVGVTVTLTRRLGTASSDGRIEDAD